MSSIAFLIDANMTPDVGDALHALEPSVAIQFVGDGIAPPKRTLDPDLLVYAEENALTLITFDKKTMPGHIAAHLKLGRHSYGVMMFKDQYLAPGRIADELYLVWACMTAEEWIDQYDYFPL